ncbi:MAG: hypothetical protein JWM21_3392 [Acidobacteria bacterium]|nr:hypothetical protein [Acidobacteriota bacterium]
MLDFRSRFGKSFSALVIAILFASPASSRMRLVDDRTAGGTIISNRAEATYENDGATYTTVSETVTVTVLAVAILTVSPKETSPSANVGPQERITRLFHICNTGNVTNSYTIANAAVNAPSTLVNLYFDNDASGSLTDGDTQITIGSTSSSTVAPDSCLGVLAVVDTNDAPPDSLLRIHLTARSNASGSANGNSEDDGTIINSVGRGPHFTNPSSAGSPPLKQVNGSVQAVVTRGNPFTYTISFRNSGDVTAHNLVLADDLPAGVEYVPNSLHLEANESRDLTDAQDADEGLVRGAHIELRLAEVAPDQVVRFTFRAQLAANAAAAIGLINFANLTADNAPAVRTNSAVVLADPFGTVYAGRAGASVPVPGATVSLFTDQALANLLPLTPDQGLIPNLQNVNPFAGDNQGHFSFALSEFQIGSVSAPARYFVKITADGFIPRLIEINLHAGELGLLSLAEHALDGQPIAVAGGFTLVREDVAIDNLGDLAFNIPMFEIHGLELTKSVDQQHAEIGDVVSYRIEVHNPTVTTVSEVLVHDHLPESFHYVAGTARLSSGTGVELQIEPEVSGADLLFRLGSLAPGQSAHLLYRVRIGANAREGNMENVAVGSGEFPSGEHTDTGAARATVRVGGGVFSSRQVIIGRVFEDTNRNGKFDAGDKPAAGVRLYLTSGQSVITDSQGLYNFPALGDGSQVVALDPLTLPAGYSLAAGDSLAGRSWTRLLRTPVGGGAMLRQNFVLVRGAANANTVPSPDKSDSASGAASGPAASPADKQSSNSAAANHETNKASAAPTAAGVYEFVSHEIIEPIAPGTVRVLSPAANSVVMSPALELAARVTLKWTVKLEVNGEKISEKNIGTARLDQKNQVATFTFVSVGLRPGPNHVRVTPISPEGAPGAIQDLIVIGRGPAQRLEVVPEKTAINAGGRDSTIIKILAFDKWDHPASDNQVAIETSMGQLTRLEPQPADEPAGDKGLLTPGTVVPNADLPPEARANAEKRERNQLVVSMEKGEARVRLIGPGETGDARLHVLAGQLEAESLVRVISEVRPTILVGLAEMSFGNAIPEVNLRGEQGTSRKRISLFYSGRLWGANSLTLAYDSQRPINRTTGHDRLFQLDPLDRVYPLYGDSSVRYDAAQSNSKLYARVDHKRSYLMFGDLDADLEDLSLGGYTRKLTGVKLRLEDSGGDFLTITGARPDTSFAREVFPAGGLSLMRLAHGDILQGSETIAVEVRDRRNPEIIISRELLTRSIDYDLDSASGEIFLLRNISTFDSGLNLKQIVVTYEHQSSGMTSSVYTARGRKSFSGWGLKLGFSTVLQQQEASRDFLVGGFDGEKTLPRRGVLKFAWATSQGELSNGVNGGGAEGGDASHIGNAFSLDLQQPLNFGEGIVRARYASASAGFLNPFGSTVTPGSRRGEVTLDFKPRRGSVLRLGLVKEDNHTANVDNSRLTLSVAGDQIIKERVRLHLGFDHRSFADDLNNNSVNSDLVTVGATVQVTDKLDIAVKREQNLGEADPTYPNQTTLSANYKLSSWTKVFLTERLAAAAIMPIGDLSQTGFAGTNARRETALGVESRFGKYTSVVGRYQLENGAGGADSFAVFGLQNRLPVKKGFSLELGLERGFHMAGEGKSFNSATLGFGWTPNNSFKASARYEFRDRGGNGQLIAIGAAGRINEGITVLSRMRWSHSAFAGRDGSAMDGLAALAIRPLDSDRAGLLFSFNHRSLEQSSVAGLAATRDRLDTAATDGYYQATKRLELYGRVALRLTANGQPTLPFVSTITYLTQARAQYRLTSRLDWAAETRVILQRASQTQRSVYGTELGFWALPDLRAGIGYNFTRAGEPGLNTGIPQKQGVYFTISSKLSNLFDLFGTSKQGLAPADEKPKGPKGEIQH